MKVTRLRLTLVEVPQVHPVAPYKSRLRTSSATRSAIVEVETDEGLTGCGEFNVNFIEGFSARRLEQQASDWLPGKDPQNLAWFHTHCPFPANLKSGVEMAFWDLAGQAAGLSVAMLLGGMVRTQVEVAACMGVQSYADAGKLATYFLEEGFTTLKAKAGLEIRQDLEMVCGVRDAVGSRLKLRLDPNQAYSREQSAELARQLEPFDLEYLEQPLPEQPLADARWLRSQSRTPIALNESVVGPASVLEILREEAADFLLPDTHIAGGIQPCVTIGRIAEAGGLPCIMHCGHDLGPKTAAMLHIAAACPAYSLANDTTYYGLEDDIITERFAIQAGKMNVPTGPGLGVRIDPEKLARYRVDC
ncbi:mandelate racemase/muconate lactonizing enzyme family protein [Lignipirellula cremea]|uniref:glucarate dehydratase n=1 Tax=Lignipirellula cremea TaxID=2528010 RepID=A0A518DW41_9BACT|nr:mandelate racemase/muconate lactonizing enzyme family protein [Lignipirellula cremea]QDU96049.1 L-Ala-D/L-Glu epimerase [Lignipirellula cremea]